MTDFEENLAADRRAAVRLLLAQPLVTATTHPEVFPLVRRHGDELGRQFGQLLGYRLTVEADFARLHKAGLGRDAGRRLERASGTPFTPRTYAYLALALAVLVTAPEQLLLSEVISRIRAAAAEAGLDLGEPGRAPERRALVAALKQLMAWQVLAENDGSVDTYAGDHEADALLTVDREIARHLVTGPVGVAAAPDDLIERAARPGAGGPRHGVRRQLVETPVVYADDLTEEERDWLRRNQRREQRILGEFTGLDTEIRAEGVALIDPGQELSDIDFPGTGTVPWMALLLVSGLVAALAPPGEASAVAIPAGLVDRLLDSLTEQHGGAWAQHYRQSPATLRDEVIDLLARLRLITPGAEPGGWLLTAVAARYAPEVTT
jgi:uncharacterized protein (TIGR02678 family)